VLQAGLYYQLAMLPIQQHFSDLFSLRYAPQGLYNYLLHRPLLLSEFPYLWSLAGSRSPVLPFVRLSPIYWAEENTGLIYMFPLAVFSILPFLGLGRSPTRPPGQAGLDDLLAWLQKCLGWSFLLGLAIFATFFWTSNRYLLDFAPPLLILSMIGFWRVSEALRGQPADRAAMLYLGFALMVLTLVSSMLMTLAQDFESFGWLDPAIHFRRLVRRVLGPVLADEIQRFFEDVREIGPALYIRRLVRQLLGPVITEQVRGWLGR
jgi:hypothetical protein